MNADQLAYVTDWLRGYHADGLGIKVVHHGDCIGADAQFHEIVRNLDPAIRIESHPCNLDRYRAHCRADVTYAVKPPLERNIDIVRASDYLIATPRERKRISMSGTWWTMGQAANSNIPVFHVPPDIRDWRPIITAPKNATWIMVRMGNGKEQCAHWAQDCSGEHQPAFSGWFIEGGGGFVEIDTPKDWKPNVPLTLALFPC
jgi:hypothetical protein